MKFLTVFVAVVAVAAGRQVPTGWDLAVPRPVPESVGPIAPVVQPALVNPGDVVESAAPLVQLIININAGDQVRTINAEDKHTFWE